MLILAENSVYLTDDTTEPLQPEVFQENVRSRCACKGFLAAAVSYDNGTIDIITNGASQCVQTGIDKTITCMDVLREDPVELLIGTASANLFHLLQGGTAKSIDTFGSLACRSDWYTPWGGPPAVRSIAHADNHVYADIHVGSVMHSSDRGNSWEPVVPDLHEDVHQVATCNAAPERVYVNTADAVFVSVDRGQSWKHSADGLPIRYGRAIAVHPDDPDCLLASFSKGPHNDVSGQLYRSDSGGNSWTHVTDGFPVATKHNIDTFHLGFSIDGKAWAVIERRLYTSANRGVSWTVAWEAPDPILAIAC